MGGEIANALRDPEVENITLNGTDGIVWVNRRGRGWEKLLHLGATQANSFISTVASISGKTVDDRNPTIEAQLPDGNRFTGYLGSIASGPGFSIRRRATQIYSLHDYVESGTLSPEYEQLIIKAVRNRKNIIVAGDTGTGKTTFVNAIIRTISEENPTHRLLIMEDTAELQCASQNSELFVSTIHFSLQDIIKLALRSIPDRLVVGEIRDGIAAWALLTAWWTGHAGGVSTLHATNAEGVLERLKIMLEKEAKTSGTMIASVVNMIIFINRDQNTQSKRRVTEILSISGYDTDKSKYVIERH
jgi:type IV secretion system protein VirB11